MAAMAMPVVVSAKSDKRGVGENGFAIEQQFTPLMPGISWYYTWGNTPRSWYINNYDNYKEIDFVPMCWNDNFNEEGIRDYVKSHPNVKYLLGYNEPNFTAQANMTPSVAASKWPRVQALAKELNLKLVAPALNYSPNAPYQDPTKWMDEFVALVGNDAFDYVAIHNYGGLGVMKDLGGRFHERYGKDVWVTEFCYWPGGAGDVYVSPEMQIASMMESVEWLEKTDFIHRYAWFKATGHHNTSNKPNYGLIITENGYGERTLSPQGYAYVYMSDFDADKWYGVGESVPAKEYISSKTVVINKSNDTAEGASPVEISSIGAEGYMDWQFDVKDAGSYTLALRVSGYGEPTRFDPSFCVESVAADGSTTELRAKETFPLPNSDTEYVNLYLDNIELSAGKQTLRLQECGKPSGIRISSIMLSKTTGVGMNYVDDRGLVNVYSVDGRLMRQKVERNAAVEGMEPGLYIVGGKKVLVK